LRDQDVPALRRAAQAVIGDAPEPAMPTNT